jgi:hypothetical protein
MKMHLVALVGLAVSFAVPAFAPTNNVLVIASECLNEGVWLQTDLSRKLCQLTTNAFVPANRRSIPIICSDALSPTLLISWERTGPPGRLFYWSIPG